MPEVMDASQEQMTLANSFVEKGQFQEAIKILGRLASSPDPKGHVLLALGEIYFNLDDKDSNAKAKDFLTKAIDASMSSEDYMSVAAAKATLGKIYIQESRSEFDQLPEHERWAELEEKIPTLNKELPMQNILFLSCCKECIVGTGSVKNGRFIGAFGDCKRC